MLAIFTDEKLMRIRFNTNRKRTVLLLYTAINTSFLRYLRSVSNQMTDQMIFVYYSSSHYVTCKRIVKFQMSLYKSILE
jgi:hypothetical protein